MTQNIIITIIIALSIGYAGWKSYKSIKENINRKNYGCAGCAFYEKCTKNRKK